MSQMLSRCLSLVSGLGALVWMTAMVVCWLLYDQLRWHPCQTLVIAAVFIGILVTGFWLPLR